MIDWTSAYSSLYSELRSRRLGDWLQTIPEQVERAFAPARHGDFQRWEAILENLPGVSPSTVDLTASSIVVGGEGDCDGQTAMRIEEALQGLHPWRKGPYSIHGIHIDSEWRSDWKWNRLKDQIQPLRGRMVLDVGCGNGYHCWRMAGAGAGLAIGIDPTILSVMQFHAVRRLAGSHPVHVLPLAMEDLSPRLPFFDTVFSMGVLYHRRSPLDHLFELRDCLRSRGELVLETLVIPGGQSQVLLPPDRYARMRNIWFIPTVKTLAAWLERCGFRNVRAIDATATTVEEQRTTGWMRFQSLPDFLDPENSELTVEGLPAPMRAIFLAEKP